MITAAHCVTDGVITTSTDQIEVVVGDHTGSQDEETEQKLSVARIIYHEKYEYFYTRHDIALLILQDEVKFSEGVQEISLPQDRRLYEAGTPITVIGWGGTEDGDEADVLQKHEYKVSDQEGCKEYYKNKLQFPVLEGMLCTGSPDQTGFAWAGDSGGPIVARDGERFVLLAVTSWGASEPEENLYDINADVHYYMSWIESRIAKSEQGRWIELVGGDVNSGVVVFHEMGSDNSYRSYTMCNDGVSQKEATAVCAGLGFKYGALKHAGEFRSAWRNDADSPQIGRSRFACSSEATSAWECDRADYSAADVPCLEGDELAVTCFDNEWEFKVPMIYVRLGRKGGNARGVVDCYPYAKLRGNTIDFQNEVTMFVVNVREDGPELVKRMKYRKNNGFNMHVGRIRPRDKVQHNCLACVAALRGGNSRFFAAKVEEDNCKMDRAAALQLVNEWLEKINEEN